MQHRRVEPSVDGRQSGTREDQIEGAQGDVLGGDEEFAGEGGFGGTAAKGFFSGDASDVGIVIFLGDVREDQIARAGIESVGVGQEFAYGVIGEMAGAGENALLDDPGIGADLEHIEVVIGFEDHAIGVAKMNFDEFRHVAQVGADGDFCAVRTEGETDRVGGIMRNGKGVDVNVTNGETLAGVNGFNATKAFAEGLGEGAL